MLLYVCTVLHCIDLYECLSVVVCMCTFLRCIDLYECFECFNAVVCVVSSSLRRHCVLSV